MKNWSKRILLLIGYSFPYAFLAMNGDATSGTMLFYGVMIVCFASLCVFSIKTQNIRALVIGNILSYISSYLFMLQNQTEKWEWYFKPFTGNMLLKIISIVAFIIQLLAVVYYFQVNRKK